MSRKRQYHDKSLPEKLTHYAESRSLEFQQYSEYHMRLMDGGYTVIDIWTTGRYWIMTTDYLDMGIQAVERGSEKGVLPSNNMLKLGMWLDKLFFPEGNNE